MPFTVEIGIFEKAGKVRAIWFDLHTGEEEVFAILPPWGRTMVVPPTQGKGCDWVLILESVE